jgi:hypothetical protein
MCHMGKEWRDRQFRNAACECKSRVSEHNQSLRSQMLTRTLSETFRHH